MIVKRTMKIEMSNLKRCKLEELDPEEYVCTADPKKRRANGFCSLGIPGDAEYLSNGSGSWCSKGWHCGDELLSNSNYMKLNDRTMLNRGSERLRPPLLRSSRGRSRMLPSRFSDSVLDTWKNERINVENTDSSFKEDSILGEDGSKFSGFVKQGHRFQNSKFCSYTEMEEERDLGALGSNDFDVREHANLSSIIRTTVNESHSSLVKIESYASGLNSEGVDPENNGKAEKRTDIYKLEDFASGDIVWAKCGKRYPAWPAIVIDPILQAPKSVLSCCVPRAICVMFFGYSKNGKQRDYAWVGQGMIFPFVEFMDRFQRQSRLYKSKPIDFQMALEEALLAEDGILNSHLGAEQISKNNVEAHPSGFIEVTGSCDDREYYCRDQDARLCAGCGLMLPCKTLKKIKDSSCAQLYCRHCSKVNVLTVTKIQTILWHLQEDLAPFRWWELGML